MFTNLNELAFNYETTKETLQQQYRSQTVDYLTQDMKSLPDNVTLLVLGYTPSFNDGDECVHRQELYINDTGRESDPCSMDRKYYKSEVTNRCNELGIEDIYPLLGNLSVNLLPRLLGTNWQLLITNKEVKYESYDCGY